MKKIFAFILATIMVLSLVPASAFAAITKDEPCPNPHTLANCEWSVVRTKEASCGSAGYTIYECDKCGVQFVANIVAGTEHVWVSDPDNNDADVEPNCEKPYDHDNDEETPDIIGELNEICEVCGYAELHYITEEDYHAENGIYVSGVGCEALYKCAVCEDEFNAQGGPVGEHEGWDFVEVLVKPVYSSKGSVKQNGLALFACQNEDCKATKRVEIKAECDCSSISKVEFVKRIAAGLIKKTKSAIDPTCTTHGQYAVYECASCGLDYRWETTDVWHPTNGPEIKVSDNGTESVSGGSFKKITSTSSSYWASKINASGNKAAGDTDYGKKYYKIKAPGHVSDGIDEVKNGCNVTFKCKFCKEISVKQVHSWYEHYTLAPTCETYGLVYKTCTVCGATESTPKDPLGHDIKTFTYPSTCGSYGYTITYCTHAGMNTNTGAPSEDVSVPKCSYTDEIQHIGDNAGNYSTAEDAKIPYTDPKTGITYPDVRVGKKVYPIVSITPIYVLDGTHKMTTLTIIGGGSEAYCTTSYVVVEQCEICQYINYRQVAGKAHNFKKVKAESTDATCAAPGLLVQECKDCGYKMETYLPQLTTHAVKKELIKYVCGITTESVTTFVTKSQVNMRSTPNTTDDNIIASVPANTAVEVIGAEGSWTKVKCLGKEGYIWNTYLTSNTITTTTQFIPGPDGLYHGMRSVKCACGDVTKGGINTVEYFDKVGNTSANVWFESREEAVKYHGANLTVDGLPRNPSCDVDGYTIYRCETCKTKIYVIEKALGHYPTVDEDGDFVQIPGKDATCTATGLKPYYTCRRCYVSIIEKDDKWVKVTASELITQPHSATLTKEGELYIEACDGTKTNYYKCTAELANGKECGKLFWDKEATQPIDKLPEEGLHSWKVLYEGVTLTCNNDGYPTIRYCPVCKKLDSVQYVEALVDGKVEVIEFQPAERPEEDREVVPEGGHISDAKFGLDLSEIPEKVEEYEIPLYINYVNGVIDVSAYKIPKLSHGQAEVKLKNSDDKEKTCLLYDGTIWAKANLWKADEVTVECGEAPGYTLHYCELCDYEYIDGFKTADEGHINVFGEVLEETCENFAKYEERVCVSCGEYIDSEHVEALSKVEEATCISEGYELYYCTNEGCTWYEVKNATPKADPVKYHKDSANWLTTNKQDYATNGDEIVVCKDCGEIIKVTPASEYNLKPGFEIYAATDYTQYAVGTYIDLTITLDSLKGVDVWAFNFSVFYPYEQLEYVGCKFTSTTGFNGIAHKETMVVEDVLDEDNDDNTTEEIIVPTGNINVVVESKEGVEIKGAQELMVLTFKVVAGVNPRFGNPNLKFMTYEAKAAAPNGVEVPVNAKLYDPLKKNGFNESNSFKIAGQIFDLNNDGALDILDAFELYALIELGGYNVFADINNNGINDAQDLSELYLIIIGAKTPEEVIADQDGKNEAEREQRFDAEGNLVYDSYCDFDFDGDCTDPVEVAAMTGRIDPAQIWASMGIEN